MEENHNGHMGDAELAKLLEESRQGTEAVLDAVDFTLILPPVRLAGSNLKGWRCWIAN